MGSTCEWVMDGECDSLRCLCVVVCLSDFFFLFVEIPLDEEILDIIFVQKDEPCCFGIFLLPGLQGSRMAKSNTHDKTTNCTTVLSTSAPPLQLQV